mgnify:CR=1 FL=1
MASSYIKNGSSSSGGGSESQHSQSPFKAHAIYTLQSSFRGWQREILTRYKWIFLYIYYSLVLEYLVNPGQHSCTWKYFVFGMILYWRHFAEFLLIKKYSHTWMQRNKVGITPTLYKIVGCVITLMVIFDCVNGILMAKLLRHVFWGCQYWENHTETYCFYQKSCNKAQPCISLRSGDTGHHWPPALPVRWLTFKEAVSYKEIIQIKWVPDETQIPDFKQSYVGNWINSTFNWSLRVCNSCVCKSYDLNLLGNIIQYSCSTTFTEITDVNIVVSK